MDNEKLRVLFVCMGNVGRSPMAEAVFRHQVEQAGLADQFQIESAGTDSYHVGERPLEGTRTTLSRHNVPLDGEKRAQQVTTQRIKEADYVVVMDRINQLTMSPWGHFPRLLEYLPDSPTLDVPDPYYERNFERVYELVNAGCQALLEKIRQEKGL